MNFSYLTNKVLSELNSVLSQIDEKAVDKLCDIIVSAERIFLAGMGRSGLVARSFAMRLMHAGFQAYVVGDVTTPSIDEGDLLIAISGSGETQIIKYIADRAKSFGAYVLLITSTPKKSTISEISDFNIILPKSDQPILPLKSAFEASAFIFLDIVVMMIMNKKGLTESQMMKKHSNLE